MGTGGHDSYEIYDWRGNREERLLRNTGTGKWSRATLATVERREDGARCLGRALLWGFEHLDGVSGRFPIRLSPVGSEYPAMRHRGSLSQSQMTYRKVGGRASGVGT